MTRTKYFYDTEFIEGTQDRNTTVPTIDLISIGIVSEDGREYYAISRDFNIGDAWNRNDGTLSLPKYWIRENVLLPVYADLCELQKESPNKQYDFATEEFSRENLIWMLQQHGKSQYTIGKEILEFTNPSENNKVDLYGYYSAYDHVALCWIFGKMIDLPNGMPMYTIDLKQELDSIAREEEDKEGLYIDKTLKIIKSLPGYPKQKNEHNALADAKWNKELYDFINKIS